MKKKYTQNNYAYFRSKLDRMDPLDFIKLKELIDEEHDKNSRKLFAYIENAGEDILIKDNPLYKFKDTDLFERMINHFLITEEYEKCSILKDISVRLKEII
jgi:hypothetical protein